MNEPALGLVPAPPAPPAGAPAPKPVNPIYFFLAGIGITVYVLWSMAGNPGLFPRRRGQTILLPDHPVWRHCMCGFPARDRRHLAVHFNEFHPDAPLEIREKILGDGSQN